MPSLRRENDLSTLSLPDAPLVAATFSTSLVLPLVPRCLGLTWGRCVLLWPSVSLVWLVISFLRHIPLSCWLSLYRVATCLLSLSLGGSSCVFLSLSSSPLILLQVFFFFFFLPPYWAAEVVPQWKFKHLQVSSQLSLCFLRVNRQFLLLQEILFLKKWNECGPHSLCKKLNFSLFSNENFASFKNISKY